MRLWVLAVLLVLTAWPHDGHAKCKMPRAFFSVPTDARVPSKPVVHLFTPPRFVGADGKIPPLTIDATDAGGTTVPVRIVETTRTPAFEAFVLEAAATTPGPITFRADGDGSAMKATATVTVVADFGGARGVDRGDPAGRHGVRRLDVLEPALQEPEPVRPRPGLPRRLGDEQGCVRRGQAGQPRGPRRDDGFFGVEASPRAIIELGQSNCIGRTFDFRGRAVWVALQALHADGSETALGAPRHLAPPR